MMLQGPSSQRLRMDTAHDTDARSGKSPLQRTGNTRLLFPPCPEQLLVLGGRPEHPSRLRIMRVAKSQRGSSAPARDLCKTLAYCLIPWSIIAPALPETCGDLDAF